MKAAVRGIVDNINEEDVINEHIRFRRHSDAVIEINGNYTEYGYILAILCMKMSRKLGKQMKICSQILQREFLRTQYYL